MTINTHASDTGDSIDDPTPTTLFTALSSTRRQHVLEYMLQREEAIAIGAVAEYIALEENDPTRDRYERILTGLVHNHLPHLSDAGLIRYDAKDETLTLLVDPTYVGPFVQLASSGQSQSQSKSRSQFQTS